MYQPFTGQPSGVISLSYHLTQLSTLTSGFPCGSAGTESACNADLGSIPGLGRTPGEGKGYPLQYSGLENSMDCIVYGVTKSRTQLWFSLSLVSPHFPLGFKILLYPDVLFSLWSLFLKLSYGLFFFFCLTTGFSGGSVVKNLPAKAEDAGDKGLIPGSGRSSGVGNGNPLQYSCLWNPMDRGAWRATVQMVPKSWTCLSDWAPTSYTWLGGS